MNNQTSTINSSKSTEKKIIFSHRLNSSKVENNSQRNKEKLIDTNISTAFENSTNKTDVSFDEISDFKEVASKNQSTILVTSHLPKISQKEGDSCNDHNDDIVSSKNGKVFNVHKVFFKHSIFFEFLIYYFSLQEFQHFSLEKYDIKFL